MKAIILTGLQCECGEPMWATSEDVVMCQNPDCPNLNRKFQRPTIELEEV